MKVYIAGPMTGIDGFNRHEFFKAAEDVAAAGHIATGKRRPRHRQAWSSLVVRWVNS